MSLTNLGERNVLDDIFTSGNGLGGTFYIALSTTTPLEDATNFTEPVGNAYARVAFNPGANWSSASTTGGGLSSVDNALAVTFAAASGGSWGTVTYWGIFDALTVGNLLYFDILNNARLIADGDPVEFAIGDIEIFLD